MKKVIFDFSSYVEFLLDRVGPSNQRRGVKTSLAQTVGCQPTYITQILNGNAHLSLEQADRLNFYFRHSKDESHYFILLVQKERAGTKSLRDYFDDQLKVQLSKRMVLTERLGKKNSLNKDAQLIYYSSWVYAAIHIATTIPSLQNKLAISQTLKLPLKKVQEVLDFLISVNLVIEKNNVYTIGEKSIRLGRDSALIYRHHSNWLSNFPHIVPPNFLNTVPLDFHDCVPVDFLDVVPRYLES